MKASCVFATLVLIVCAAAVPCAATYIPQDLGTMGGIAAKVTGISNQGHLVGDVQYTWGYQAFLRGTDLVTRTLPAIPGQGTSHVTAVNSSGVAVGYSTTEFGRWHANIWGTGGGVTDVDTTDGSWINDINDLGQSAGYVETNGFSYASTWNAQGEVSLLNTPADYGGGQGIARSINGVGQVAGVAGNHVCVWDPMAGFRLLDENPQHKSDVFGMNDAGDVVGWCRDQIAEGWLPCVWRSTGERITLSALHGRAYGINNLGQVVGELLDDTYGSPRAFYWDSSSGLVTLPCAPGSSYSRALAINDNGWIVGDAGDHAMLWQPVPEPSSLLALLTGVGGMGTFLIRRRTQPVGS